MQALLTVLEYLGYPSSFNIIEVTQTTEVLPTTMNLYSRK